MIPTEIATRLQLLIQDELHAVDRVRPLASDLPQLDRGARFQARILEALPDGSYRAMVANHQITLALPEGAKSGDVLELVVTGHLQNAVTARIATTGLESLPPASAQSQLSQTGQLISQVLTGRHTPAQPMPLNGSQPLLPTPSTAATAAELLPALRQAVSNSGLFYEAHQAQWVAGKLPLQTLLQEPQAQTQALPPHDHPAALLRQTQQAPTQNTPTNSHPPTSTLQSLATLDNALPEALSAPPRVAESLMPTVHQQLDTLATNQAIWQGFAWPGQPMQWQIEEGVSEDTGQRFGDEEEGAVWQSTLRLQMPGLGQLEARLIITAAGVAIRLEADSHDALARLQAGEAQLGDALAAAGVQLTGFAVAPAAPAMDGGQDG